jgi:putative ABC transport system permease protein
MFNNYIKIAFRNLLRQKIYSLINITGLAIGMACCILILLYVQNEMSYDRYHRKADRIYRVERKGIYEGKQYQVPVTPPPMGPTLMNDFPEIENVVRIMATNQIVCDYNKNYADQDMLYADNSFFQVFDFSLLKGDVATALTAPFTAVLTPTLAQRYLGTDNPVGKTLRVQWDGKEYDFRVTGILKEIPANSHFRRDIVLSFETLRSFMPQYYHIWMFNTVYTYILVQKDASIAKLNNESPAFLKKYLGDEFSRFFGPDADISKVVNLYFRPLTDIHLYSNVQYEIDPQGNFQTIIIFAAIALMILLVACINFMNLATARSARRAKEVGIRKVAGANRSLIIRQFLGESILLAFIALIIAVMIVEILIPFYNQFTLKNLSLDYFTNPLIFLGFIFISLVVGILAGSYPAFYLSSFQPAKVLKGRQDSGMGRTSSFIRKSLVLFQFSISIILIIGTLIVISQIRYISQKKLGFDKEQVVILRATDASIVQKIDALKAEMLMHPDIRGVSVSSRVPGNRDYGDTGFKREGFSDQDIVIMQHFAIDEDFVPTLGIEMAAGRNFSKEYSTDEEEGFLINETAVSALGWTSPEEAINKKLDKIRDINPVSYREGRVIGVMRNFNFKSLHRQIEPLVLYIDRGNLNFITVRINTSNIARTLEVLESVWKKISPNFAFDYFFMDDYFNRLYQSEQRMQKLFLGFSVLAILVSCLGLLGLASYSAERRTKEIGIRKSLGASSSRILVLITMEFLKWVLIANFIAWPVAFIVMRKWLENFAYRVNIGAGAFLLATALALLIALLTVSFQSVRAARINPVKALHYE